MSKVQMMRGLVEQRLTAAAEEIFGLFERTIAEYEEELCRSKEENERQRKRLDAVFSPQLRLHRAELPQRHGGNSKEVEANMPVITSVGSEANSDPQLHRAESQDQKGGQHGDSGSARNAEPEPKKRRRKSRSPSNNVDNTNISKIHPNTQTELPQQHGGNSKEVEANMPVITSVGSEANGDPQLHRAESQDQKGGQHGDSGSARNAEPEPKKRRRKSRSHSNNVDNTNTSEVHPNTQTELPQQHVCEEEEVLSDQQLCIQVRNSSLDQEDPEPPQIHEEQEKLCTNQEGKEDNLCHSNNVNNTNLPEIHRNTQTDVQQLWGVKAEVPPEQQAWRSSLDQEDTKPPPIKEEQEELWTSQEGEEADIKFPITPIPVKKEEEDEEKPQSSHLHESQTEENREAERTGADGEDCGEPEPARNSDPDPDGSLQPATHDKTSGSSETNDSGNIEETREPQTGLNPLPNNEEPVSDVGCNTGNTSVSSSECTGSFGRKKHLQKPSGVQTGGKTSSCSICGKQFPHPCSLKQHLTVHTGEKPFSCSVCHRRFALKQHLTRHSSSHITEKLFSCSVCDRRFAQKHYLNRHLASHTGEKSFNCSVCDKKFSQSKNLKRHLVVHMKKKPLSCLICNKGFGLKEALRNHMRLHSEGKILNCSVCKTSFSNKSNLMRHMRIHTGEKPFSCSACDRRFSQLTHVKSHKCVGENSRSK